MSDSEDGSASVADRSQQERLLKLAGRNRLIAQRLNTDFSTSGAEVALHVVRAWRLLDALQAGLAGAVDASVKLPAHFPVDELVFPDGLTQAVWREQLDRFQALECSVALISDDDDLFALLDLHCDLLCRAELLSENALYGSSMVRAAIVRHRRGIAKTIGALVLLTIGFYLWRGPDPWRALFYTKPDISKDFQRETTFRSLHFDWTKRRPLFGFQSENYAARFDACLDLTDQGLVKFSLGSDDGSRMFLNGDKIIDRWGASPYYRKDHELQLTTGVYHLQVDFMQLGGAALIDLDITVNDRPLDESTVARLRPVHVQGDQVSCG